MIISLVACTMLALPAAAQVSPGVDVDKSRFSVPDSVSPQAKASLEQVYAGLSKMPSPKEPVTQADFDAVNAMVNPISTAMGQKIVNAVGAKIAEDRLGGVPVLHVTPANPKSGAGPIVYIHGGGFVLLSARATAGTAAFIAAASGREVVSIDYTLAPRGNYGTITDQVVSVWKALLAQGRQANTMGMAGDSAGGSIAVASTLKIRDQGAAMPGALFVMSPSTDLSGISDTFVTLKDADPVLHADQLLWAVKAYVGSGDARSPYASPVYGDFKKPFPPTLIQAGTRELLLSDSVRLYQAILGGGGKAVLDVYEGMPHVFQSLIPAAPEARTAGARASEFLDANLRTASSSR